VAVLGGIIGVLVGFAVGVTFTEWLFPAHGEDWRDAIPIVLAVIGGFLGAALVRTLRRPRAHG